MPPPVAMANESLGEDFATQESRRRHAGADDYILMGGRSEAYLCLEDHQSFSKWLVKGVRSHYS